MTASDAVVWSVTGDVGELRLNRPAERNAMTPETLAAFEARVDEAIASNARAVVLTGSGECFSAGADLRGELQKPEADAGSELPSDRSFAMYGAFLRLLDLEVPIVCALNGHAVGGGFGLSLLADLRIARRDAKYGANFVRIGIHPGLGISYLLPRLVGSAHAAAMLYTGDLIDGDEAARIGLANIALEGDQVLPHARAMAARIADAAPLAVRATRRTLRAGLAQAVRQAAGAEAHAQAETLLSEDAQEGVRAFLEKRPPRFVGR